MLDWFRKIRKVSRKLTLPSRDASSGRSQVQLNPQKLTPSSEIYLGQLSYLSLVTSQLLERDAISAPTLSIRQSQLRVAETYKLRHKELAQMISKLGQDAVDLEDRFVNRIDSMIEHTKAVGWHESIMRIYIVFGILEHSAREVGRGLSAARRSKVEDLLRSDELMKFCSLALKGQLEKRPELAGSLAMFGRSVVADALLEVRNSVSFSELLPEPPLDSVELARAQFKVIEPFVSELIAAHTVRMDELGLTA